MKYKIYNFKRDPQDLRRIDIPDEEITRWHIEYYQQGESLTRIGKRYGISRFYISRRFQDLGLPVASKVEHRKYTPPTD